MPRMCNAHFQHFFDDSNMSSSNYPPADIVQQQQQQQQRRQDARSQLALHPHDSSAAGQDGTVPTLSPVSTSGWTYPMDAQSDVQMYSPASTTSYSSFHSPIDTNARAYALAGALHQQQQQQQSGTAYPESSQRSTEVARGAPGHGSSHPTPQFFPEMQQQMTQRWGYAGHAHAHPHEFSQEALSMSRAPIIDPQAQTPSASDSSAAPRDSQGHMQPVFAAGNMSGGARLSMSAAPDASGDQRPQGDARQIHQSLPHNLQQNQQHRTMTSQSHQHQLHQQQQQWHAQAHSHQAGGAPFLQAPTPRSVNMSQAAFFPYAASSGHPQLDHENESDDFGDHEEFDEGDEEDGPRRRLRMGIRPNGSPTPELQYPQDVSGTPSELMRANFMLYGVDPANWPLGSLSGFAGADSMGTITNPDSGSGIRLDDSSSFRLGGGMNKGKLGSSMTLPEFFTPPQRKEKGKRAQGSGTEESEGQTVKVLIESATPGEPPKKVKMHQCRICQKLFPRPSGLATHMNSHSGARPFKCPLALCPKTFAVRSNARRHLRTHGITVPPNALNKNGQGRNQEEPFQVGFETPVVVDVQDPSAGEVDGDGSGGGASGRPPKLRWVPPSLATRTNAPRLRSLSPASDMVDIDTPDVPTPVNRDSTNVRRDFGPEAMMLAKRPPGLRIAPAPLPPAVPSVDEGATDLNARFDERNSYAEAGTYPYHPDQFLVTDE